MTTLGIFAGGGLPGVEIHGGARFEDLSVPVTVSAVHESTGELERFGPRGPDLVKSVLASMSIAGVFPPVEIHGVLHSDGGPVDNVPIPGNASQFDRVFVVIPTAPLEFPRRGAGSISRLLFNIHLLMRDQVVEAKRLLEPLGDRVVWIEPPMGADQGTLEFSKDHALMDRAAMFTGQILADLGD